ncbi:FAR1 DNA binding domain, zinc finger, SWIM-type, MULE transposase domain containing protein, partial [Tanacetum coccineum]
VQIVRVKDHVGYYIVDDDGNRTWYPDNDIGDKPLEGCEFVPIDQAYDFYKDYGKRAGFDVRKGGHYKPKPNEDPNLKWFLCSKEGKNPEPAADKSTDVTSDVSEITTDENVIVKQTRNRGSSRCGCLAKIRIKKFERNLYRVYTFIEGHNHPLVAEKDMIYMKSSRDDDKLVGLFWADEQAIRDYAVFGDIVSFDATFHSQKYKMVFVPFTSINHHNRCITFASGLLSDETVGAYKWLLEEFKNAFSKDPNVVITDQDPSMKIAIPECFPNTRHRLWTATDLQMEKEASTFYTRTVFFDVQDEIYASYSHCMSVNVVQVDNTEKYYIRDMQAENRIRGDNNFVVYQVCLYRVNIMFISIALSMISSIDFCKSEMEVECSCKHYEAYGLLCRHIFYVLRMNNIKEFPRKYLNKRWLKYTKPFNAAVRRIVSGSDSILESEVFDLYKIFESTIDRLVYDMDKLKIYKEQIKDLLNKAKIDVPTVPNLNSKDVFSAMLGVKEPTLKTIRNPDESSNKGTGVQGRLKISEIFEGPERN